MEVSWEELEQQVNECQRCPLARNRTHVVLGEGNRNSPLMLVGEGPGEQEDLTGRPFVGAAGQLLDKMLAAIGIRRENVYICNVVKCRPPQNRAPVEDEQIACRDFLNRQFELIQPQVIVCLGATPAKALIDPDFRITIGHGKWVLKRGVWIMPMYHPAALLYDASKKRPTWEDLKLVRNMLVELGVDKVLMESEQTNGTVTVNQEGETET